jgi:hypothetical protein
MTRLRAHWNRLHFATQIELAFIAGFLTSAAWTGFVVGYAVGLVRGAL